MDWQSYEELVKSIYKCLGEQQGVSVLGWGNACRVQGRSGVSHQIDVLTSHTDGLIHFKAAVECKHWNKKVGQDVVLHLLGVLGDTDIDKGIIVSKSGFTEPAKKFASQNGIGLLELREPVESDWKDRVRRISMSGILRYSPPYDFEMDYYPSRHPNSDELGNVQADNREIFVKFPDGVMKSLHDILNEENKDPCPKFYRECEHKIEFPQGSYVLYDGKVVMDNIIALNFKRRHSVIKRETYIDASGKIWLILEDVSGKRRRYITHAGEIDEWIE